MDQLSVISTNPRAVVFPSDYGTGKTLQVMAAARRAAEDPTKKVMFIPATSWTNKGKIDDTTFVLNMSMEKQFIGSPVEVVTNILSHLNTNTNDILTAAQLFINKYGDKDNLKLFLDEVPVSADDKEAAIAGNDSSLSRLLNVLEASTAQVWLALRSGDLIDTAAGSYAAQPPLSLEQLKTHLTDKTVYQVVTLARRVRNTSNIGRSVPANVLSGYGGFSGAMSATVIPLASSHTVPGVMPVAIVGSMGSLMSGPDYPSICHALRLSLAKLHLASLPKDCVILCGAGISPKTLGEHLGPGAGVQVYHAGVETYDRHGAAKYLPSDQKAGQEDVVRKWLDGVGGCLLTHNHLFCGMEAATAVFISITADEPWMRSGLLRGVGRVALLASTDAGYEKDKLGQYLNVYDL